MGHNLKLCLHSLGFERFWWIGDIAQGLGGEHQCSLVDKKKKQHLFFHILACIWSMRMNYKSPSLNTLTFLLLYVPFCYCSCFINWLVTGKRFKSAMNIKLPFVRKTTHNSQKVVLRFDHIISNWPLRKWVRWPWVTKPRRVSSPVWMERGLIKVGWPRMIPGRCWAGSGLKSACFLFPSKLWGTVEMGELGRFHVQIHF